MTKVAKKKFIAYEVVPTKEHLAAFVEFFQEVCDEQGIANFKQRDLHENEMLAEKVGSPTFLNGILGYLQNEDFVKRLTYGATHEPSKWDASLLLAGWDEVKTRDIVGRSRPIREQSEKKTARKRTTKKKRNQVKVDVVSESDRESVSKVPNSSAPKTEPVKAPKTEPVKSSEPKSNPTQSILSSIESPKEPIAELKDTMKEMVSFLKSLPDEMSSHLTSIADKIEPAKDDAQVEILEAEIEKIEQEKKDLILEVQRLKTQLEEVSSTSNYSKHQIYRQRNSIMDEIDRMVTGPAWSVRQNGPFMRDKIEQKLDLIMEQIGIEKPSDS